jgi:hypothetical protein
LATVEGAAQTIADSEYAHLQKVLPGFTLTRTTVSALASVVYIAVAVMIVAAVFFVPATLARSRAGRQQARQDALRRETRVRGSKVVKRQAGRSR